MSVENYATSTSITDFRQAVIKRGGVQQPNRYRVWLQNNQNSTLVCYPESITLPQRSFNTAPYSPWGPIMQIPIRREYGECSMSFIIYEDFAEKKFLESWMDSIMPPNPTEKPSPVGVNRIERAAGTSTGGAAILDFAEGQSPSNIGQVSANAYGDVSRGYNSSVGKITIATFWTASQVTSNGGNSAYTSIHTLKEAYPLTITPISLSSEATGYTTFVVIFAFKEYSSGYR